MNHVKPINMLDLLILTLIFFGLPIYTSLSQFFLLQQGDMAIADTLTFTEQDNLWSILLEVFSLCLAAIYLFFRRFDFRQLPFSFAWKSVLTTTLGVIFIAGSVSELYLYFVAPFQEASAYLETGAESADLFSHLSLSLVAFSLLNGFFEEVFFLGIVFAVNKKALPYALVFSLVIRFLFHTYQGMFYAVDVLLFGIVLLILRSNIKNLVPFALAHAFFDIFGLGLSFMFNQF